MERWNEASIIADGGALRTTSTKGYDVQATRISDARRTVAFGRANAKILDSDFYYPLFVREIEIDISLAGKTAQGRWNRDFYPRNFVQPNFIIRGQSLDQEDYGQMCDFLRHLQRKMLENNVNTDAPGGAGLVNFYLNGGGIPGGRNSGPIVKWKNARYNQSLKGQHESVYVVGYPMTIARKHSKGVYAPTWEFALAVSRMRGGPWEEDAWYENEMNTWIAMLNDPSRHYIGGANDQALISEADHAFKWATQHQGDIFATPTVAGSGSTTASSGTTSGTGKAWRVQCSMESTDLGPNGGAGCAGPGSADLNGYSELQNCNSLGGLSCKFEMYISGNGKTAKARKVDCGGGSSFNPVIGLYPAVQDALDIHDNSTVTIWAVNGQDLSPKAAATQVGIPQGQPIINVS